VKMWKSIARITVAASPEKHQPHLFIDTLYMFEERVLMLSNTQVVAYLIADL